MDDETRKRLDNLSAEVKRLKIRIAEQDKVIADLRERLEPLEKYVKPERDYALERTEY